MIIISLYVVPHLGPTKTFDLTFIGYHNIRLESYWTVMKKSVHVLSLNYDVCACALTVFYYIHYINSDLRRNFIINGYGIFLYLCLTISYPRTMSAYDLLFSVSSTVVSMLYSVFYTSVSTLDSIPSSFDSTLTIFSTLSAKVILFRK